MAWRYPSCGGRNFENNAPINAMPHPLVLGLTGGGGGRFVLKILPQGWGNCIITWGLGVGVTSGVGRGFDMLMWPQGWGLCNRKYGKSPPFPHISTRTGGVGHNIDRRISLDRQKKKKKKKHKKEFCRVL